MNALTRDQVRTVDRIAIEQLGIPGVVLMENAGRAVAEETLKLLAGAPAACAILCGGGNNGGDGYVAARHLHNAGLRVIVLNAAPPLSPPLQGGEKGGVRGGDAAVFRAVVEKMGLPCRDILDAAALARAEPELAQATVFVDALLGTGFHGEVHPHLAAIIRRCNALAREGQGKKVVAVDVPSGMDCDTGRAADPTIRADLTVTFVALKKGFLAPEAQPYLGRVVVASIGTPPDLVNPKS
jgi:NAD(P)H-hydrate epimerase